MKDITVLIVPRSTFNSKCAIQRKENNYYIKKFKGHYDANLNKNLDLKI